jgi:glutamine amidotransferase
MWHTIMITIIDYGMGNLRSVSKALEHLGHEVLITADPAAVAAAGHLILPGVGAFGDAMHELERRELVAPTLAHIAAGKPLLGICLGMQLLLETSEESPDVKGLGVFAGAVRRFRTRLKVPHMGWNTVRAAQPAPLFNGMAAGTYFYFVHSFYADPIDRAVAAGVTDYDGDFCSVLWRDNVLATQFHPEKSQQAGLAMLRNFAAFGSGGVAPLTPAAALATTA